MKILIVHTKRDLRNEDVITVPDVEAGIEKLFVQQYDAVIFSNELSHDDEIKFRAVLQRQNYQLIALRQEDESLETTIEQTREILKNIRLQQIVVSDTLNAENLMADICVA